VFPNILEYNNSGNYIITLHITRTVYLIGSAFAKASADAVVTVFANPAPKTDPAKTCTRTPASASKTNPAP